MISTIPLEILSESLARNIDRRTFLKRTSQSVFAGLLAVAVATGCRVAPPLAAAPKLRRRPSRRSARRRAPTAIRGGGILSGCHGGHCFQHLYGSDVLQCRVYYQLLSVGLLDDPIEPAATGRAATANA